MQLNHPEVTAAAQKTVIGSLIGVDALAMIVFAGVLRWI